MSSILPSPTRQTEMASLQAWEILENVPGLRFQGLSKIAAHLVGAPAALIALAEPEGHKIVGSFGLEPAALRPNAFCAKAMLSDTPAMVIDDATVDLRFANDPLVAGPSGMRFCVAIPMRASNGNPIGALCVLDRKPRALADADLQRLMELASALAEQIGLRRDVVALCEAALRDPVTGLGNRTAFECSLDGAIRDAGRSQPLAVLCVHTDGLQQVNAIFGHGGGDQFLAEMGRRLHAALPDAAAVARIGADEFALLLFGEADVAQADQAADAIIDALAQPMTIGNQALPILATAGLALYPEDGDKPALLLDRAKATLQEAKRDHKGGHRRFEVAIERDNKEKHELEQDLRTALEQDQFYLYWQPIADAATRQPVAYEALLRWDRPGHGPVAPGQFIGAAEACGLSGMLDAWVLRTACREAASWPDTSLRASVNVSANRIRFGDLSDSVAAALATSGLAPNRLEIEITERVLTEDEAAVRKALEALRALGVRIALDDFGTGVSSLSYLRSLPLDKLKLDRSFTRDLVADPRAQEVARTVVRLGSVLGLIVLAEGVETEDQLSLLRVMGCDEVQGYLLGWPRPMLAATTEGRPSQRSALRAMTG